MTDFNTTKNGWQPITLVLHSLFAFCIIGQLITSTFMHRPKPGRHVSAFEAWGYQTHEYMGILTLILLICYVVWAFVILKRGPHLFPWSRVGWQTIWRQCKALLKGILPASHSTGGLSGLIHGLGLLLVIATASTGTIWWLLSLSHIFTIGQIHPLKEVHEWCGTIVWFYLGGHVSMAILHWLIDAFKR
ncbi:cytochrome b/b6 domain-containing protein [Piscirickettsia litoralis]|uniref:Cytochrome b561 bacterial/Ni-hydrogenase domain-containing protein n=1 Tax=Piscirickettsia litoralis TaxID=1891921 RepID=A0ABX3A4S4_9GAMM|nr:cytochrome b/b6 domain-containing protein [Piscirickettsia litoralis]ODN43500.1 hypothetical protein BGC07_11955 [Piscirickettsia litoralis]